MSAPEFFRTPMGKTFFEAHVPRMVKALEKIAERMPEKPEDAGSAELAAKIEALLWQAFATGFNNRTVYPGTLADPEGTCREEFEAWKKTLQ